MGLDLTLFMADWERLGAVPADMRSEALTDATLPPELDFDDVRFTLHGGWLWPPDRASAWCAEYDFATTTGAYSPHWHAGNAWDDMRHRVDPPVREAMDAFVGGLVWAEDPDDDLALIGDAELFPGTGTAGRSPVLIVCTPRAVAGKAEAWLTAEPLLEGLRDAFVVECLGWSGRPTSFEYFTALLREWGDVVREAARRGWGLVGLP
jgi:hypothetical protein